MGEPIKITEDLTWPKTNDLSQDLLAQERDSKTETQLSALNLDGLIEKNHQWLGEFIKGNVEPAKKMFSHKDDASLAGPQPTAHRGTVPIAHGWEQVSQTLDSAISYFREGEIIGFDNVAKYMSANLAFTVEVERFRAKVGGNADLAPVALRVTSIFRREDGAWKVVHRHADPITSIRPPESITQR
jgi:ketosteroid isomerase-like protein